MVRDFDQLISELREGGATQSAHSMRASELSQRDDDADRIRFGFDRDEWRSFLRRIGMDQDASPESRDD